jgi:hypothetical protein
VPLVADLPERRPDQLPAPFVVECALDGRSDERRPAARPDTAVELADECVVERNVHTHVLSIAHGREGIDLVRDGRIEPGANARAF